MSSNLPLYKINFLEPNDTSRGQFVQRNHVLKTIVPDVVRNAIPQLPPVLDPLTHAVQNGAPLGPAMVSIVESLGFDSFAYGTSTTPYPTRDSRTYIWTTLSREWLELYDQNSYIEIDPRLAMVRYRVTPILWDRNCGKGDRKIASFLDDAADHGTGSGVALLMRDKFHRSVVVLLNSRNTEISSARAREINHFLGPVTLLASHFHEAFMENVLEANLPPGQEGAALSAREVQCLQLAARGLTSADIAFKLNLATRTVNFHFANVMSKLAAANRVEAIAIAVSRQIIGA